MGDRNGLPCALEDICRRPRGMGSQRSPWVGDLARWTSVADDRVEGRIGAFPTRRREESLRKAEYRPAGIFRHRGRGGYGSSMRPDSAPGPQELDR